MMTTGIKQRMTVETFDQWVQDADGDYEFIAGETWAVVSNNYCSQIALFIGAAITLYARQHGLGWTTGSDGGYQVRGERYIPDVGFIRRSRQPERNHDTYNPLAPDLAVEVVSPTDREKPLLLKLSNYLAAGTVVWIVYPDDEEVHVHQPGEGAEVLTGDATLTAEGILPGFSLKIADIFSQS